MAKAIWENTLLAESAKTIEVEGNQYFPPDSIRKEYLRPSSTYTTCPWKGIASYYNIEIDGHQNRDAAWYYPDPKPGARQIKGYIAFWKGVKVEK
jgi:uncharacterized protein (DUF427 family)